MHRYFYGQEKLESSTIFLHLPSILATANTNYLDNGASSPGAGYLLCSMERHRKSLLPAKHKISFPDPVVDLEDDHSP